MLTCLRVSRTVLASSTDSFSLRTSSHMALSSLLSNTCAGLPFEGRQRPHSMALFVLIAAAPAGIYWGTALHALPTQLSYPLRWAHCTTAFHTRYNVSQALSTCNANVSQCLPMVKKFSNACQTFDKAKQHLQMFSNICLPFL